MSSRQWTNSQKNAIYAKGGSLLVSAAAGSGKTAVLVQRVIEMITDKSNPCDADRLLVVTFTKAAAAEMRARINTEISNLLKITPNDKNLQRQQLILSRAHISTIHSFCNELIRENFYKLNISSEFKIADENEIMILKDEAIRTVLEEKYERSSPEFLNMVETFSSARDDNNLIYTVYEFYDFIRSHPFKEKWLSEKFDMYNESNINDTEFFRVILNYAIESINHCLTLTKNSIELLNEDEKIKEIYGSSFSSDLSSLFLLKETLNLKTWDNISDELKNFKFDKLKALRGYKDDIIKVRVNENRKEVKAIIDKLKKLFYVSQEECIEDIKYLKPIVKEFFALTNDFEARLNLLKAERNILDFSDLEHLTLKLLVKETNAGFERTQEAYELSLKFDQIMVDEYQDTNEVQDLIFRALSHNEENLFMVGDVKQSIYRFRQAMPEIFLRRKEKYLLYDETKSEYPYKIILDKNFRSREGILDATNFVFSQLMSKNMGEMEYTNEEKLKLGAEYDAKEDPDVYLKILDLSCCEDNDMDKQEARYISGIIAQMIGKGYKIKDKNGYRNVTYGDFCILLRSANKHAINFVKELELCGVPAWCDVAGSFFGTIEVSTMLSFLRIIDNPIQDIPILSILMSPIYGFTPDELSEIRCIDRAVPIYFALKESASAGNEKCKNFLRDIEGYRQIAATMPSDRFIQYVYNKTSYLEIVQAMDEGNLRLNNLRLLLEYARNYEASGYRGISSFIRFIDKVEEQKSDLESSNEIRANANVVKIMSIHRSKGLEFPICIIANCSRKFNKDKGEILLHPKLGLGIKRKDLTSMCKYTNLSRDAISLEIDKDNMSEELRVLYVAMTRAKENLIMITSLTKVDDTICKLASSIMDGEVLDPYKVRNSTSFSEWILYCALRHPDGACLRKIAGSSFGTMSKDTGKWSIEIVRPESGNIRVTSSIHEVSEEFDEELLNKLNSRINYTYAYKNLSNIRSKVTVSDIVAQDNLERFDFLRRPLFISGNKLSAQAKGTILHNFMQFVDFKKAKDNLDKEIDYLMTKGFVSIEDMSYIDKKRIKRFLNSNLMDRILRSKNVLREFKFTIKVKAGELGLDENLINNNHKVILQGSIDCAFEEDGQFVIVDYKTSALESMDVLEERYHKQLALYKKALSECTDKKIKQCILYSFNTGKEIFL